MLLVALCCSSLLLSSAAKADPITTVPYAGDLSNGTITHGTCVGGTSHVNLLTGEHSAWAGADTLQWGACSDTFAIQIAVNEALSQSGISVDKLHYKWKWINGCYNVTKEDGSTLWCSENLNNRLDSEFKPTGEYADQFDSLVIEVQVTDANGNAVVTKTYDYDTWYHWAYTNSHSSNEIEEDGSIWQITEDEIEFFNHITGSGTIHTPNSLGNISFVATGMDGGQYNGYYGPVVRGGEMWFTYRGNPCELDTLYHPTCAGYAEVYSRHLYDTSCNLDPLYDIGCSGYDAAYLDQQCTYNALYSIQCPMYQVAYFNNQCDLDSQYDVACPNYSPPIIEEVVVAVPDPIAEIIAPVTVDVVTLPVVVVPEYVTPVEVITPEVEIAPVVEVTTESIETELIQIEDPIEEPIDNEEPISDETVESEPITESVEKEEKETTEKEEPEPTEDETNDEPVEDEPKKEENLKPVVVEKKVPTKEEIQEKKDSRSEKIKNLIAAKIKSLSEKANNAETLEEQVVVQALLLALIAFVPDFDYAEQEVPDTYFYPPEPTVDHAFSRWFVNDPNFGVMEDSQYPNLRK